ncbi:MAG: phosphatidate cytidylyltransferase [Steroidobacteraceae bacterium]|jgi:phosphatidate cytidylyltransferase|nr:phosphatidate cytidylyltransferase [Steroidobacteraceae bacterium]
MIGSIIQVTLPGFALGAIVMMLANRRVAADVARARWLKLVVFGFIVHAVLGAAALGRAWVVALLLVILGVGAWELAGAWRRMAAPRPTRVWGVYLAAAALGLWATSLLSPAVFAFLFIVTAACDGFSQVVGQWLGRQKLAPVLSPGKTVEGLLGGLVAAAAVAVLARALIPLPVLAAAALGAAIGLSGLAGDLSASWVKRRAGLKDYSALLPGQGGVLDRFDSLLGALALAGVALAMLLR